MFNDNKKQYINVLQQDKQLKINYKIIQDDKIIKEEQSSFIINEDKLPKDAEFKINALQKDIKQTYIATLTENDNQQIIPTKNIDIISYDSIKIGSKLSITSPKNEINSLSRYFEKTGIDFIISPFTILEKYLEDNGKNNSLNIFIYNNTLYTIIYNNLQEISYSKVKVLTPFESTQDETFLEDDIVGQKLYEEVNFLEIQQFLNETVEEYYHSSENIEFLENIEIIYTLKPINEEQVTAMQEALIIPISSKAISLDGYMDEVIQEENSKIHNFVNPRVKKENKNVSLLIALILVGILVGIAIFNFTYNEQEKPIEKKDEIEKKVMKKIENKKSITSIAPSTISLPSHKKSNISITENIQMLFDVLPYDAVLKDIEINKNSSTYVSNFIANSDSLSDMRTKLKNIYAESKVLLEHQNKIILNTIIQNNNLLSNNKKTLNVPTEEYKIYNFLSLSKATDYLTGLSIRNSKIKFDQKIKSDFLTYQFIITSQIKSPKEFLNFVDKINLQKLSVVIDYPVVFSKITDGIEVKYKVQINQQNKKTVSLKK